MTIPIGLNNIGLLFLNQKEPEQAISYYSKALESYSELSEHREEFSYVLENIRSAYEMKNDD